MSRDILKPKVFISYAWGTQEYQNKVMGFAGELQLTGIEVVIDKVSALPGNDLTHFMESCVTDDTITNVLILLDENYAKKADARIGGAGAETQIISPKIYNQVKQEKFIPVVFERGLDGAIFKPAYLTSISHFDLTDEDNYDNEFQRLVRTLAGKPTYVLPELGNIPDWVDTPQLVSTKTTNKHSKLKMNLSEKMKVEQFQIYLLNIEELYTNFTVKNPPRASNEDEYITLYNKTSEIRNEFLSLIQYSKSVEGSERLLAEFFENIFNKADRTTIIGGIQLTLVHEMFIYLIAVLYKKQNYEGIGYVLGKTYFSEIAISHGGNSFQMFYYYNNRLDISKKKIDDRKYYCGTAQIWIDNLMSDLISKDDLVFADILCYHYSLIGDSPNCESYWFPITYVYGGITNKLLKLFSTKLQSRERLIDAALIFGYTDIDKFRERLVEIEKYFKEGKIKDMRYPDSFDSVPMIFSYVMSEDIGKLK